MPAKERKLQPSTRDKSCQICGSEYTYPVKDSRATRFQCEGCAQLPASVRKVLARMAKRIQLLEKKLKQN